MSLMKDNYIIPMSADALLSSRSRFVAVAAGSVRWAPARAFILPGMSFRWPLLGPFAIVWPHDILIPDVLSFLIIGVSLDDPYGPVRVFIGLIFNHLRLFHACHHLCTFMIRRQLSPVCIVLGSCISFACICSSHPLYAYVPNSYWVLVSWTFFVYRNSAYRSVHFTYRFSRSRVSFFVFLFLLSFSFV
jgi:hypothetical protein